MRGLRWWSLLLVPGGFVAGHELGYAGASALGAAPATAGGHGYLTLLVLVGVPFALAVSARAFLAGLREQLPPVGLRTLGLAQVGVFLAVELREHLAVGLGPAETLVQPAVLLGLVAQVAVATLLHLIVRTSHGAGVVVAATIRRPRPLRSVSPAWRPAWAPWPVAVVPVASLSRRGPPATAT